MRVTLYIIFWESSAEKSIWLYNLTWNSKLGHLSSFLLEHLSSFLCCDILMSTSIVSVLSAC